MESRNEDDCRKLITDHIKPNNTIITDGWNSYNFLDCDGSNYVHKVHIHGPGGNFGLGVHFTSFTEGVWGTVKQYIKKIYNNKTDDYFVLSLERVNLGIF